MASKDTQVISVVFDPLYCAGRGGGGAHTRLCGVRGYCAGQDARRGWAPPPTRPKTPQWGVSPPTLRHAGTHSQRPRAKLIAGKSPSPAAYATQSFSSGGEEWANNWRSQ